MTARNISIEAYHKHLESGKALVQWVKIYQYIDKIAAIPVTRAEIAKKLNMRDSSVCGRVNEMLNSEPPLLKELGRVVCTVTAEQAHALTINTSDSNQMELL